MWIKQIPYIDLMDTTPNITDLAAPDRFLLDQVFRADFNLESLISSDSSAHPAQHSLIHLLAWLEQPLIKSLTDLLVAAAARAEAIAQARQRSRRITSLEKLFQAALALIPSSDGVAELQMKDPSGADKLLARAFRSIREARLVAHNIEKALNPVKRAANASVPNDVESTDESMNCTADHHTLTAVPAQHTVPATRSAAHTAISTTRSLASTPTMQDQRTESSSMQSPSRTAAPAAA